MKLAKKLRSNKGFTLVELVVVIAVLAILAGVGSVAYSGYIKKANEAADVSLLAAVKTAADAAAAAQAKPFVVKSISITIGDGGKATAMTIKGDSSEEISSISISDGVVKGPTDLANFLTSNTLTFKSDKYVNAKGADWDSSGWHEHTGA